MLAQFVQSELGGSEIRFHDLYKSGFDPRLTATERASYNQGYDSADLANEIANLHWAEALILVFPTWWFGFPAILKGWFDRVWSPGVAFENAPNLRSIEPRLALKKVIALTTLGAPWWSDWVIGRPLRRVLKTAILGACAPRANLTWISIYRAENLSQARLEQAKVRIRRALSSLGSP